MPIKRVQEAIEAIKNGEMVIMMDDEDRENEGDLVYAATFSTPEMVNFMASEAKGLICVSLTPEIADQFGLNPMVSNNDSQHETAFTVSVDAKEATTGISAHERDLTIKILADSLGRADQLVRPGHIFPLIAKKGGVLQRTGHTEGSVDLCKLAGIAPVAVICEIMKEDGTMARRDDLIEYAKKHHMKIVYISDLTEYRLRHEALVKVVKDENREFFGETARVFELQDHRGQLHHAYLFGTLSKKMMVKFHNVAPDIELLEDYKKHHSLTESIRLIQKEGGVVVCLDDRSPESDYERNIGVGSQILTTLGISELRLVTAHGKRHYVGLNGFGLDIVEEIVINS